MLIRHRQKRHTPPFGAYSDCLFATPEHNAHIKRFFRTLKEEELYYNLYETYSEAITLIEAYIDFYNNNRIHSALGYLTPSEYYKLSTLKNVA